MNDLKALISGARFQYPFEKITSYQNRVLTFVDGSVQSCPRHSGPVEGWKLVYSRITENEMSALQSFFESHQAGAVPFRFEDPETGAEIAECILAEDQQTVDLHAHEAGSSRLHFERRNEP